MTRDAALQRATRLEYLTVGWNVVEGVIAVTAALVGRRALSVDGFHACPAGGGVLTPTRATFDGEGDCFIEAGGGKAGFGSGDFCGEPTPKVKIHAPSRAYHAAKVLFEKAWLRRWF